MMTWVLRRAALHVVLGGATTTATAAGVAGDGVGVFLTAAAKDDGAVCLDGSAPGYYFREGTDPSKFLVALHGGGWCYGPTENASKFDCAARANTSLGSSSLWSATIPEYEHGMTSSNCSVNPAFCTWSVAYVFYCDGHSFAGDRSDPVDVPGAAVTPFYYRGRRILRATLRDLISRRGLDRSSTVVLSGHSAGGLATYLLADYVHSLLPATVTSFSAAPDAGFFLDHPDVHGRRAFGLMMRTAFSLANASGALNAACKALHADDPFACVLPQYFAHAVQTRMHVIQSQYDSWQLGNILSLPCQPQAGSRFHT